MKGKLKEEFEGWVSLEGVWLHSTKVDETVFLNDTLHQLPLSMQFALLCDFLEEKEELVAIEFYLNGLKEHRIHITKSLVLEECVFGETKQEAIEYLNQNYEH